jgi:hypothetical protein
VWVEGGSIEKQIVLSLDEKTSLICRVSTLASRAIDCNQYYSIRVSEISCNAENSFRFRRVSYLHKDNTLQGSANLLSRTREDKSVSVDNSPIYQWSYLINKKNIFMWNMYRYGHKDWFVDGLFSTGVEWWVICSTRKDVTEIISQIRKSNWTIFDW